MTVRGPVLNAKQAGALRRAIYEPRYRRPEGGYGAHWLETGDRRPHWATIQCFWRRGLISSETIDGYVRFRLTPYGEQVRASLLRGEH